MSWLESDVVDAVARMYGQEAVLARQVAAGTGAVARRHLDAIAVGVWPSRGLFLHGIEAKVSRADLKRELAEPGKADEVACYCDKFFIAAPEGICKPEDLPETWGLIVVKEGSGTRVVKDGAALSPQAVDRTFLAALVRSALSSVTAYREREIRDSARKVANEENEDLHGIRLALGLPSELELRQIARLAKLIGKNRASIGKVISAADKMARAGEALQDALSGHESP